MTTTRFSFLWLSRMAARGLLVGASLAGCAQSVVDGGSAADAMVPSESGGADMDATAAVDGSEASADTSVPVEAQPMDGASPEATAPAEAGADARTDAPDTSPVEAGAVCPAGSTSCGTTCCPTALDLGIYNWNIDTTAWSAAAGDILNWGTSKVTGVGSSSIRVYVGVQDIYQINGGAPFATPLAAAQAAAYDKLFSNPSLSTYFLTTYTASDENDDWSTGYAASQAQAETSAISDLASYLLQTYPTKTFAILNWEGDNAISPYVTSQAAWTGFLSWTEARIAGVRQAQAQNPGSASRVAVGLEFNYTTYPTTGGPNVPCGTGTSSSCVVSQIAPNVAADFYSYSSWQSLAGPAAQLGTQLHGDLSTALALIQAGQPQVQARQLVVGEFGAARDDWGECPAAERVADILPAIQSFGSAYAFYWQAGDNPASTGPYVGFGLYKYDGSTSLLDGLLQAFFTGNPLVVPSTGCNTINMGGVVNGVDYSTHIPQGSVVAIFGASFMGTGDVVHVWANGERYTVSTGSPNWYDSTTQINATLPSGVVTTEALVYVTSGAGVDSNGQLIEISAQ